jgi:ribosome-binding ATPase YchF (GTP1/OBG family)
MMWPFSPSKKKKVAKKNGKHDPMNDTDFIEIKAKESQDDLETICEQVHKKSESVRRKAKLLHEKLEKKKRIPGEGVR